MIHYLKWDSDFFNKSIGKLRVLENKRVCGNFKTFDLIYVYQNKNTPIFIEDFELSYFEEKIIFQKSIKHLNKNSYNQVKSVFNADYDVSALYELAYLSGTFSRFNLDKNFKEVEFRLMYKMWVDNSLSSEIADDVFIHKSQNKVNGFITFKRDKSITKIGLVAVNIDCQGNGVGRQLVNAVEAYCKKNGCDIIQIPTQKKNKSACEFYNKLGYRAIYSEIIKHFWRQ